MRHTVQLSFEFPKTGVNFIKRVTLLIRQTPKWKYLIFFYFYMSMAGVVKVFNTAQNVGDKTVRKFKNKLVTRLSLSKHKQSSSV